MPKKKKQSKRKDCDHKTGEEVPRRQTKSTSEEAGRKKD